MAQRGELLQIVDGQRDIRILGIGRSVLTDLAKYYDNLCDKHGNSFKAVDAGGQASLDKRYSVLTQDAAGKDVLDVGCGQGNIDKYMAVNDIRRKSYTGIDISGRMVEEGKKLYPPANLIHTSLEEYKPIDIMTGNLKQYDLIVAQGLFYRLPQTTQGYQKVMNLVRLMVSLSKDKVAFCCLSTWADDLHKSDDELLINPVTMLAFLRQNFGRNIQFRHDYLPHDCCFYLGREDY